MVYTDGNEVRIGDVVQIDERYRGRVVACMEAGTYAPGYESWAHLGKGIMVDTDFGGLVHYLSVEQDHLVLLERVPDS